jgi:hypothetical protein
MFFETAPIEQAATVLTIARGILARRQKPAAPKRKTTTPPAPLLDNTVPRPVQ